MIIACIPEGGLFIWIELPEIINSKQLLVECLENNVAFVSGVLVFPNSSNNNTLRLNYANMPEERIEEGIERIGEVLKK